MEWKDISGYPSYQVSDDGRVRSIDREIECPTSRWGGPEKRRLRSKVLRVDLVGCGYQSVLLGAGRCKRKLIHRLVAGAFLPGGRDGQQVNHLDGDKTNNKKENLAWVWQSENMRHAVRVLGVRGGQFGPGRVRQPAGARG